MTAAAAKSTAENNGYSVFFYVNFLKYFILESIIPEPRKNGILVIRLCI